MSSNLNFTSLVTRLLIGAGCWLLVGVVGCDNERKPQTEATGYVYSKAGLFTPREMTVSFDGEVPDEAYINALIESSGATILHCTFRRPDFAMYLVKTPLGKSLAEVGAELSVDSSAPNWSPNFVFFADSTSELLYAEDGSRPLFELRPGIVHLPPDIALEFIVTVRGFRGENWADIPTLEVAWVDVLRERVVTKSGALSVISRGVDLGVVVILVEGDGKAWELLGSAAGEIAQLPGVDGAHVTVTGCERHMSPASRAGGYWFRVNSYALE